MSKKPILGITMGDPASIGPEITVKALSDPAIYEKCSPIIIGDAAVMEAAVGIVGKDVKINAVSDVKEAKFEFGTIDVYDMKLVDMDKLERGVVSAMAGNAAFQIRSLCVVNWNNYRNQGDTLPNDDITLHFTTNMR